MDYFKKVLKELSTQVKISFDDVEGVYFFLNKMNKRHDFIFEKGGDVRIGIKGDNDKGISFSFKSLADSIEEKDDEDRVIDREALEEEGIVEGDSKEENDQEAEGDDEDKNEVSEDYKIYDGFKRAFKNFFNFFLTINSNGKVVNFNSDFDELNVREKILLYSLVKDRFAQRNGRNDIEAKLFSIDDVVEELSSSKFISRNNVRQSLSRLTKEDFLVRERRGHYYLNREKTVDAIEDIDPDRKIMPVVRSYNI